MAVVLIVLASCGPRSSTATGPSSGARTTPGASPSAPATIAVLYQARYGATVVGTIHEATVDHGVVADRTVFQTTSGELADSNSGYAILALPRPGVPSLMNGPQPATVDLATGALRVYDIGPGSVFCILRSPDPTKLLVCQQAGPGGTQLTFLILDLRTGAQRVVAQVSPDFGRPIRWSDEGIFFTALGGASEVDPQTLAVMRIKADATVTAVSPGGSYLGGTKNIYGGDASYCSDSIFLIRKDWTSIASGARQGSQSTLVSQAKKDFRIVDIADDGSVIYTESDCPPSYEMPWGPTSLYYFSGGRSTLQSGLSVTTPGFYMAATISHGIQLGGSVAVLERHVNGTLTDDEIDVVHLCSSDGCQPALTTIVHGDSSVQDYAFSVIS